MKDNLITIIIPYTNNNINKTIESINKSTYRDIEIIIYGSDNNYKSKYNIINRNDNGNRFSNIKDAINSINGKYVSILYPGNEVTIDYYRGLYEKMTSTNSDMIISNYINNKGIEKIIYNLIIIPYNEITGSDCLDKYMEQEGLNNLWNLLQNRLYSVELLKKLENKNINSDFAFNYYIFSNCKKINKIDNDYVIIDSFNNITEDEYKSIFADTSFIDNKYEKNLQRWNDYYCDCLNYSIKEYNNNYECVDNSDYYYAVETNWNDSFEKIKERINDSKITTVSFDIFDTLIVRPFLNPQDLFDVVDKYFRKLTNNKTATEFKNIRVDAEKEARILKDKNSGTMEVTLDEIYDVLINRYYIDKSIATKLKEFELEQEYRFCTKRNSGYELYSLSKYLNKNVICTSDMYLSSKFLNKVLNNNGINIDNVYVSCEYGKSKAKGDLYSYVAKTEKVEPNNILHIGDNVLSDITNSSKNGFNNAHLPKATDIFFDVTKTGCMSAMYTQQFPFWIDNKNALNFNLIRTVIAVAANKYLDNPFVSFRDKSDFNSDPYLIGYFLLGSYMYGITKWMLDDIQREDYDSLVFMARDGYLPMKCYDVMKEYYKKRPESKYLYISRKSLIPVIVQDVMDFYKLPETLNVVKNTPNDIVKYINDLITYDQNDLDEDCKKIGLNSNKCFNDIEEYNSFVKLVIDKYYDKNKHDKNKKIYTKYFEDMYNGHSATFDIGYSARPSYFISNLLDKPIDTYFCNISHNQALRHADMGGFKLKTFFDGKPATVGHAYEMFVSALSASCVAYDIVDGKVVERFGNDNFTSMEKYAINTMQNAALDFVKDIVDVFKEDISVLYTENYYISLPFLAYMNSSKEIDKYPFGCVDFEDDLAINKKIKMTKVWQEELDLRNQYNMPSLLLSMTKNNEGNFFHGNRLVYNSHVDLNGRSKIVRIIYYLLFDRETYKRRIDDILHKKHK